MWPGPQLAAAAKDLRHPRARQALAAGDIGPRRDPSCLKLLAPGFGAIRTNGGGRGAAPAAAVQSLSRCGEIYDNAARKVLT